MKTKINNFFTGMLETCFDIYDLFVEPAIDFIMTCIPG